MTILEKITAYKRKEVEAKKKAFPTKLLTKSSLFDSVPLSLATSINLSESGIIAEYKRRSPSKSVINEKEETDTVTKGYENAGVSGISVLTDTKFFGGSLEDLLVVKNSVEVPLLRKEFIIDPYQIYEAKAYGASTILLIAAILSKEELKAFSALAKTLHLDVLLEIHNEEELKKSIHPTVDMIGVNNRNLKTFEVSLETSKVLSEKIPSNFIKVSESGIDNAEAINELKQYGYQGFLIGESFMKTENPGHAAKNLIEKLK